MKNTLCIHPLVTPILFMLGIVILALVIGSCMRPETKAAHDAVIAKYEQINEDGIVTEQEASELRELVTTYYKLASDDMGSVAWEELVGTALASIIFSITGVNFVRNRSLPGTHRLPPKPSE